MIVEPLAVPSGAGVVGLLPRLARALDGTAPVQPYAAGTLAPQPQEAPSDVPGLALVVATSGSTGTPKLAMLTATALRASADATHKVLGGPGSWLLALPAHHVAGIQVLLRSVAAGTTPTAVDLSSGFTPEAFTEAAERHHQQVSTWATTKTQGRGPTRRYASLVPTQVVRLLDDPTAAAALAAYDAVLVGGAAVPVTVRDRSTSAGVRLVPTYGMSETAGGCVYAGRPLPGTTVRVQDGRVLLGGATLSSGYLNRADLTAQAFETDAAGGRWFRTEDAGHLDADGVLHVDGRLDDLVNTGGLKVSPRLVEDAILRHVDGASEVVVVGAPDAQWGQVVCAAVLTDRPDLDTDAVREALRPHLPAHALPHRVLHVTQIPQRGPGKPDRAAVTSWFAMGD